MHEGNSGAMNQWRSPTHVRVAIVGAGFGGIGMGIRLKQAGIHDFTIFERAGEVGGVWRDNHYPGAACDVQSHLYSLSFAPNPGWTHSYSRQPEILEYLRRCARDFGLLPHIRLHHEVRALDWDEAAACWRIATAAGDFSASALVLASGGLAEPKLPDLPGLAEFRGAAFHSARWDHAFDLRGKQVAVIGTGASAIQFVPAIQPLVARLHLFQRTPAWVLPRLGQPIGLRERRLLARFPLARRALRTKIALLNEVQVLGFRHPWLMGMAERAAQRHLALAVRDPALRAKLTPSYRIGCKRILISDDFYPAVAQPNVELIAGGAAEVREHAVVGRDGIARPAEAIIFGTGFAVTEFPFGRIVRGSGGRSLAEQWGDSPRAHLGTTVAGFPNLFTLLGPNTGLGHTSVLIMIEAQIEHILGALRFMERSRVAAIEPRQAAQDAFNAEIDRQMRGTVWTSGGCASWYLDRSGRNSALWPGAAYQFRLRVARFQPGEYLLRARRAS